MPDANDERRGDDGHGGDPSHQRSPLHDLRAVVDLGDRLAAAGLERQGIVDAATASIADTLDCAAVVFLEDNGYLVPAGVQHRVPEGAELIRSIFESVPHPVTGGLLGPVVTSGDVMVVPVVPAEMLRAAYPLPEHAAYFDRYGLTSLILLPMRSGERVLGVVAAAAEFGRAPFNDADVLVATELCNRVTMALEISSLHQEAERAAGRLHAIVEASADAVITIDCVGRVVTANAATEAVFGWPPELLVGQRLDQLLPTDTADAHQGFLERYLAGGAAGVLGQRRVVEAVRRDGTEFWAELSVAEISDGGEVAYTGFVRDVTERVERQEELARLARVDHLTGALNRRAMRACLTDIVEDARAEGGTVAVIFVDLDDFKAVNDRLGHEVGDIVLRIATDRIRSCIRTHDALGRWGGDELVVAGQRHATGDAAIAEAVATAERIRQAVGGPVRIDDLDAPIALSASVGSASFPHDGSTVDELIRVADAAMFAHKRAH